MVLFMPPRQEEHAAPVAVAVEVTVVVDPPVLTVVVSVVVAVDGVADETPSP